ncbi:HEAT repeat domain-containing protein [Vampirovibrio sp.]|uniref:HEAT repeat domain-containing protein n=1 Tax=Vampirovibrio sp. TaxID=2717857 RepID=UPI0035945A71
MAIPTTLPQQMVPPSQPAPARTSGALVLNINGPFTNVEGESSVSGLPGSNNPAGSAINGGTNFPSSPALNAGPAADTFQRRNNNAPAGSLKERLEQAYLNAEQARNEYLNIGNQVNGQAFQANQTPQMPQPAMTSPMAPLPAFATQPPQTNPQQFQQQLSQLQQMQQTQLQQQQQQFQQQMQQQQAEQQAQIQQLQQQNAMLQQQQAQAPQPQAMDPAMQQQQMMQQMQPQNPYAQGQMDPATQQQMMMQQMQPQNPYAQGQMDPAMQQQMMMQQMQPQNPYGQGPMDPAMQQQQMMQQQQPMDPGMQQQPGGQDFQAMRPEELNMVIANPPTPNHKLGAILEFAARQQGNRETYELLKREALAPTSQLPPGQAQEDGNLVRQAALFALGNLNRAQNSQVETAMLPGLDSINNILGNAQESPAVKAAAVTALGYIDRPQDKVIQGLLNRAAKDPSQDVKNAVQQVKSGLMSAANQAQAAGQMPPQPGMPQAS